MEEWLPRYFVLRHCASPRGRFPRVVEHLIKRGATLYVASTDHSCFEAEKKTNAARKDTEKKIKSFEEKKQAVEQELRGMEAKKDDEKNDQFYKDKGDCETRIWRAQKTIDRAKQLQQRLADVLKVLQEQWRKREEASCKCQWWPCPSHKSLS
jgi:hypothetical protein